MGPDTGREAGGDHPPQGERGDDPALLTISTRRDGSRATVELRGEIDLAGTETLTEQIRSIAEGASAVDLDASDVRFIDSSGLVALLTVRSELTSRGIAFRITSASDHFLRVVKLAGLDDVLFPGD